MRLCMFSPSERHLERGWPGRIDGDRVTQLAAQTLQSFFTGGGVAREHETFALEDVVLRAPVLHPPSVRLFGAGDFAFANPAAILGPTDVVHLPSCVAEVVPVVRQTGIVGADGEVAAYTLLVEWTAPTLAGAKRNDFALTLGPVALTPDALPGTRWDPLVALAGRDTRLVPGDLLAAPPEEPTRSARAGDVVDAGLEPFGPLRLRVAER
jgi:hypothetical protein